MPQSMNTVHPWLGMSVDCEGKLTAEHNPTPMRCHFVIEDAELSVHGVLVLVQTFETGPIYETTGMFIIKERHQPPMQHLHNVT